MKAPDPALREQHHLLEYVVAHWDYHTKWLEQDNKSIWNRFGDLAMYKCLPFDSRKWGTNEHYGEWGCTCCLERSQTLAGDLLFMSLVHYAASIGHLPLLLVLPQGLSVYCAHESNLRTLFVGYSDTPNDCLSHILRCTLENFTPPQVLDRALSAGHIGVIRTLVRDYGTQIAPFDQVSAVRSAIQEGQNRTLEYLLDEDVCFDLKRNSRNREALDVAFARGHDAIVAVLIRNGLLPSNDPVWEGKPRLHFAASRGNALIVQALMEAGEPVDGLNDFARTALCEAANTGHSNVIRTLLDNHADIEAVDGIGYTALHYAAISGHLDALRTLCQRGANVDAKGRGSQWTALHRAAVNGQVAAIQELVKWGANLEATDWDGKTLLDVAIRYRYEDAQAVLRELGAKDRSER